MLRPEARKLFIASSSPAEQTQRMELRTGTVSERAESQRARRGFERVRISLTFKLCGAVTVSLFNLLVSDPWTWGEEGRICSDSPRPVWAGRPERGVACVCSPGARGAGARAAAPLLGVRHRGSPGCPVLGPVFVPGAAEGGVTPAGLAAPRRAARRTRCSGRVVTASPATRALARSVTRSSELWHTGRLSRDVYRVAAWRFSVETEASRRASFLKVWTR